MARGQFVGKEQGFSELALEWFRQNFLREKVFVSGRPEVNQYELSAKILDSVDESTFSW